MANCRIALKKGETITIKCPRSLSSAPIIIASKLFITANNVDIEWADCTALEEGLAELDFSSFDYPIYCICRYFSVYSSSNVYGKTYLEKTAVDHWFQRSRRKYAETEKSKQRLEILNGALSHTKYLVGDAITLADIFMWTMLYSHKQFNSLLASNLVPENVSRWYKCLSNNDAFRSVVVMFPQNLTDGNLNTESVTTTNCELFTELPGAEMGKVVVRFSTKADGYLHIGHAKAAILNAHYQVRFQGQLIMRFNDTNPEKETEDYEEVILEDVTMLEIKPDRFTFMSDHFDSILEKCEFLLNSGDAFVDDTDLETMKTEREQRVESRNRNNSSDKNWSMWEEMKRGTEYGKRCCVRAKIDMKSVNGCLRDPTLYRCKPMSHPRTGNKYNVYPTYDFACPIADSVEGVTHALRTMEFRDRDDQFFWVLDALKMRKPHIHEYSRLTMTNTVLSKQKLTWFVDQGVVEGWDDPRMPTVRGILRRGLTVEGLKQFILAQGPSRSAVVVKNWRKIWVLNRKVIQQIAPVFCTVQKDYFVSVIVEGAVNQCLRVAKNPDNTELGTRDLFVGPKLLVNRRWAECVKVGDNVSFFNWNNSLVTDIKRNGVGEIETIRTKLSLDNKDLKVVDSISWVLDSADQPLIPCACVFFNHLISKPVLGKDEDFKDFVNKDAKIIVPMLGDNLLKHLKKGDIIQLQKRGFFICDEPYDESLHKVTCQEGALVLFEIPDDDFSWRRAMILRDGPFVERIRFEKEISKMYEELSEEERASSLKEKAAEKSPKKEVKSFMDAQDDMNSFTE